MNFWELLFGGGNPQTPSQFGGSNRYAQTNPLMQAVQRTNQIANQPEYLKAQKVAAPPTASMQTQAAASEQRMGAPIGNPLMPSSMTVPSPATLSPVGNVYGRTYPGASSFPQTGTYEGIPPIMLSSIVPVAIPPPRSYQKGDQPPDPSNFSSSADYIYAWSAWYDAQR
jgi:hypothetical protein